MKIEVSDRRLVITPIEETYENVVRDGIPMHNAETGLWRRWYPEFEDEVDAGSR